MTDEEVRRIIDEVLDKEAYSIYTTDVFRIIERRHTVFIRQMYFE
jgi:hypothetical protein